MIISGRHCAVLLGSRASNAAVENERLTLRRSVASPGIVAPSASLLLRRRAKVHASRDRQVERMSTLPTAAVGHAGDQALRSTRAARRRFRRRSRPRACSNACEAHRKTKFSDQCMRDFPQLWTAVSAVAYARPMPRLRCLARHSSARGLGASPARLVRARPLRVQTDRSLSRLLRVRRIWARVQRAYPTAVP